jgi:hypothetical protein
VTLARDDRLALGNSMMLLVVIETNHLDESDTAGFEQHFKLMLAHPPLRAALVQVANDSGVTL